MGTIKIENEHSLKEAFRSGVNLFVGAGFSIDAKNKKGDKLPLGKNLALELRTHYCPVKAGKSVFEIVET